jgi:two-component system KDP operon response regulator KdpE
MSGNKILIIDDDQPLLLGLTARLKANGYSVVCATDAVSAVAVARKEVPDLVILDLGLPAGDGFLVLERLRGLTDLVATPVIVLSARIRLTIKNVRWTRGRWPSSRSLPIIMNS